MKKLLMILFIGIFLISLASAKDQFISHMTDTASYGAPAYIGMEINATNTITIRNVTIEGISGGVNSTTIRLSNLTDILNETVITNGVAVFYNTLLPGKLYFIENNLSGTGSKDVARNSTYQPSQSQNGYTYTDFRVINISYNGAASNNPELMAIKNIGYDVNALTYSLSTSLNSPVDGSHNISSAMNFTASYIMTNVNLQNATYSVYYQNGSLFNRTTKIVYGSTTNSSTLQINDFNIMGNYTWNVNACATNSSSTICSLSANNSLIWGYVVNSATYDNPAFATNNATFQLNVSLAKILSNAYLYYNGTAYPSTITSYSDYILLNNLVIPSFTSYPQTPSFYWLFNFADTSTINTSTYSHTVTSSNPISIGSTCSAGLTAAFNFNFADEQTFTNLNASSVSYNVKYGYAGNTSGYFISGNFSNINSFSICINQSQSFYTVGSGEVDYQTSYGVPRKFYIFGNTRLTNITITNTLYDLNSSVATAFKETVEDNQLNLYRGAYTALLRWYPSNNSYTVVEMSQTDDKGQSVFNVQTATADYRIAVYQTDGTLIQLFNPVRFICQVSPCEYTVFITTNSPDYTSFYGVQNSLIYNETTHIFMFTWNDPSQATHSMNLTVTRINPNNSSIIVCSTSGNGFTGIITCDVTGQSGMLQAVAYRSASPASYIASLIWQAPFGLSALPSGKGIGLFFVFILASMGALIGVFSPIAAIILGIAGLIPAYFLGIVPYMTVVGFAILGGIIYHFLKRS